MSYRGNRGNQRSDDRSQRPPPPPPPPPPPSSSRKRRAPLPSTQGKIVKEEPRSASHSPDMPNVGGTLPKAEAAQQQQQQSTQFVPRPGYGSLGRSVQLKSNRFRLRLPRMTYFHYHVTINPEMAPAANTKVIVALGSVYRNEMGGALPVYDGKANMFTARQLPLGGEQEAKWELSVKLDPRRPEKKFQVSVKLVAALDVSKLQDAIEGRVTEIPYNVLQALEVIMHMSPSLKMTAVGRSFFPSPQTGGSLLGRPVDLGRGCELWFGYHMSVKPSMWAADINIDMAATAFYKEQEVLDFLAQTLNFDSMPRYLSNQQINQFNREMKGMRVESTHVLKRKYRVNSVTVKSAAHMTFPVEREGEEEKGECSVASYFEQRYSVRLRFPDLPCLHVGPKDKTIYLPLEVCRIASGQRCVKTLEDKQKADMIRSTAKPAFEREASIRDIVSKAGFGVDAYLKEFGLQVDPRMCELEGRVLPAPEMVFGQNRSMLIDKGQWDMRQKSFCKGVEIQSYAILVFVSKRQFDDRAIGRFASQFQRIGRELGICVCARPSMVDYGYKADDANRLFNMVVSRVPNLNLIVVISNMDKYIYAEIKRLGDMTTGIATQFIKAKNAQECKPQVLSNIFLKINIKLGGVNSKVAPQIRVPIMKSPVIFLGADVSHPGPGFRDEKPSLASIVGSMNEHGNQYRAKVSIQKSGEEIILGASAMTKALLIDFYRMTRVKPQRIVFYRDGVSDGQFATVLNGELRAIKMACRDLEVGYEPGITFVVVQKRHHTRLFAKNRHDQVGRSGNVPPGTVVDKSIVHPKENDFYLCSQFGIQGTSRPSHYHVLWDENGFSANDIQLLTYHLCYMYSRCNRSVSIPAPVYYADLAASRAAQHIESDPSLGVIRANADGTIPTWMELKTHDKSFMYFA